MQQQMKLFCVTKSGKSNAIDDRYFPDKRSAKAFRDECNEGAGWNGKTLPPPFVVRPGPDHHRYS